MLYEEDPNKGYMKFMGLSFKRRDSCDYLKDVYGGILNILMKENNIARAMEFLQESLDDLIKGKVSMDKLPLQKPFEDIIKIRNKLVIVFWPIELVHVTQVIKPKPGDRMKFVFIVNDTPICL